MIVIAQDRYSGVFVDGARGAAAWFAVMDAEDPLSVEEKELYYASSSCNRIDLLGQIEGPWGEDSEARKFCDNPPKWVAWGPTPDAALKNLQQKLAV
jgi:hypothetical protein